MSAGPCDVSPRGPSVRRAGAGADAGNAGGGGAVASEEDDCVIVCARDADAVSGGAREWRGMAHGYGGGPPPPLLHLPPASPATTPSLYHTELLWKQRAYPPPLHAPLHHALADDYLAATYDRERHERLLR